MERATAARTKWFRLPASTTRYGGDVIAGVRMKALIAGTMLLVGGLFSLATSGDMDKRASIWAPLAVGAISTAAGALLLLVRRAGSELALHLAMLLGAAVIVVTVGLSDDTVGLVTGAGFMVWVSVYAACFFSARLTIAHVAVSYAALGLVVVHVAPSQAPLVIGGSLVNSIVMGCCAGWLSVRLRSAALVDPLTGVANSRAWRSVIAEEFERADRNGHPLSVAFVDVDGLKQLNDADGHSAGDLAIAEVAHALSEGVRSVDVVARIGGDEFIVLLPDATADAASAALGRVRERSSVPFSIGVAERRPGESPDEVVERADHEMYEMKRRGRDRADAGRSSADERGTTPRSGGRRRPVAERG